MCAVNSGKETMSCGDAKHPRSISVRSHRAGRVDEPRATACHRVPTRRESSSQRAARHSSLVPNREGRGGNSLSSRKHFCVAALSIGRLGGSRWRGGPMDIGAYFGTDGGICPCTRAAKNDVLDRGCGRWCGLGIAPMKDSRLFRRSRTHECGACLCTSTLSVMARAS